MSGVALRGAVIAAVALSAGLARADITKTNPPDLYNASSFSHVVTSSNANRIIFLSAQSGRLADGTLASAKRLKPQLRQVLANLSTALAAVGATPNDVVRVHVYVPNYEIGEGIIIAGEMRNYFNYNMPTSTFIPVSAVGDAQALVAIDAVAETGAPAR